MNPKLMRGWAHIVAVVIGLGLPVAITFGTLRTGGHYEMAATPQQAVTAAKAAVAGATPDAAALAKFVDNGVIVHGAQSGKGVQAFVASQKHAAGAPKLSMNGDYVIAYTAAQNSTDPDKAYIEVYRVFGGKVIEYWTVAPDSRVGAINP